MYVIEMMINEIHKSVEIKSYQDERCQNDDKNETKLIISSSKTS